MEGTPESTQQKPVPLGGGRTGSWGRGLADLPATRLDSRPDPTSRPRPPVLLSVPRRAHPRLCNPPPGPSAARLAASPAARPGCLHTRCLLTALQLQGLQGVAHSQGGRPIAPTSAALAGLPQEGQGWGGSCMRGSHSSSALAGSVSTEGPASSPVSFLLSHAVYTQWHAHA